tara:strand:- start:159 stop:521 length:363 start_codon:yes stop_codon:yes gene_type:complete
VTQHFILILITIFLIEAIKILKIKNLVINLLQNIKKLPSALSKSNKDEKFEKIYFQISKLILFESLKLFLFLLILAIFFLFIYYTSTDFFYFVISIKSSLEIFLIALIYLKIKNFYAGKL